MIHDYEKAAIINLRKLAAAAHEGGDTLGVCAAAVEAEKTIANAIVQRAIDAAERTAQAEYAEFFGETPEYAT